MRRGLLSLLGVATLVCGVLLVACGGDEQAAQQPEAGAQPEEQPAAVQVNQQQTEQASEDAGTSGPGPLKIGVLFDFTGQAADIGEGMLRGFELAIAHINAAGGVFGQPVEVVIADTMLDPTFAVEEARRLIEVEGVHAIVGAVASSVTLPLAESIAGPHRIPIISPSAQSRQITIAEDNDFLFRASPASGPEAFVLADLIDELGYDNVGLMVRNDAWGQSFAEAFLDAWEGEYARVDFDALQGSYLAEIQQAASGGAETLVLLTFPSDAEIIVREAIENGIFDYFVFTAGGESLELAAAVGPWIVGMYGTAPTSDPQIGHAPRWNEQFEAEFGEPPQRTYIRETYDATVAIALAAQAAQSTDGTAIRDQLRAIADAPGEVVEGTAEGVARGLTLTAEGTAINFEGVSSTMAWDERGDLKRAFIKIWQFNEQHEIVDLGAVIWENGAVGDLSAIFSAN